MVLVGVVVSIPLVSSINPFSPGVNNGDWATYKGSFSLSGNPNAFTRIPGGFRPTAGTAFVEVSLNITAVTPESVTFMNTSRYSYSATPAITSSTINVTIGWGPDGPPFIIGKGLAQPNQLGYESPADLNDTRTVSLNMTVVGSGITVKVWRIVNFLTIVTETVSPDGTSNSTSFTRYGWDQATGVPVTILTQESVYSMGSFSNLLYGLSIKSTNMWTVNVPAAPPGMTINPPGTKPEGLTLFGLRFPELYVLIGVTGGVVMGFVALAWKRKVPRAKRQYFRASKHQRRHPSRVLAGKKKPPNPRIFLYRRELSSTAE